MLSWVFFPIIGSKVEAKTPDHDFKKKRGKEEGRKGGWWGGRKEWEEGEAGNPKVR